MRPAPAAPSASPAAIDLARLIDQGKVGGFQMLLLAICGLCLIIDGFDVQAMGYVAPAIIKDWGITKASLGPVFGAGLFGMLFGMLVGSLVFGVLGDRFGRRPVLIIATFFFALACWPPRRWKRCRRCSFFASSPAWGWAASCPTRWRWPASSARRARA